PARLASIRYRGDKATVPRLQAQRVSALSRPEIRLTDDGRRTRSAVGTGGAPRPSRGPDHRTDSQGTRRVFRLRLRGQSRNRGAPRPASRRITPPRVGPAVR